MKSWTKRVCSPAAMMRAFCAAVIVTVGAFSVRSQERDAGVSDAVGSAAEKYELRRNDNEFGVWGGGSFSAGGFITALDEEQRAGRRLGIVGVRYGRVLGVKGGVAYEYTIDVLPVVVATNTEVLGRERSFTLPDGRVVSGREVGRGSVYGFGFLPIGLKFNFGARRRVKPFAGGSAGFIRFREPVPVFDTTRTPFAFDFGGGVQIFSGGRQSLTVGYKFHHISNANTSPVNPGLDSNIIYAGYSFWK